MSWNRWTTLVMVAHLFLAVTIAAERAGLVLAEMIPLTRNEIRHLFIRLVIVPTRYSLDRPPAQVCSPKVGACGFAELSRSWPVEVARPRCGMPSSSSGRVARTRTSGGVHLPGRSGTRAVSGRLDRRHSDG